MALWYLYLVGKVVDVVGFSGQTCLLWVVGLSAISCVGGRLCAEAMHC